MKRKLIPLFAITAFLIGLCGPTFTGCGTLNKSGVYAGNKVVYDFDLALETSYQTIDQFLIFEMNNRAHLDPRITKYADDIRRKAPGMFQSAVAVRDAYRGNPTDGNRAALQVALDTIREAASQALQYMVANKVI